MQPALAPHLAADVGYRTNPARSGAAAGSAHVGMTPDGDSHAQDPAEGLRLNKRKTVAGVILALLLSSGAFIILRQVMHFKHVQDALAHIHLPWLGACVAGQLLAYLGYILAYHDVARASGGPRLSWKVTATIVSFGAGASVLAASVGGLAVDYWALRRSGTKPRIATRRVLAVGTIEWTVLALYGCAAAAVVLATGERAPLGMALAPLIVVPLCVAGAAWFTTPTRAQRFAQTPRLDEPAAGAGWPTRLATRGRNRARMALYDAVAGVLLVRHVLSHPLRYRGGTIGYPIYWAGDMLTLFAALHAFGGSVAVPALVLAYVIGNFVTSLPLPAGGAGGVEASIAFTLHAVGGGFSAALLAAFLYRVITFWLPIIPALILIPAIRKVHRTLPAVPHTSYDPDEGLSFRPSRADAAARAA